MAEKKKTGGLAGVTAGETHLCTVGKEGAGLTYVGYDIHDLAEKREGAVRRGALEAGHATVAAEGAVRRRRVRADAEDVTQQVYLQVMGSEMSMMRRAIEGG